MSKFQTKTQVLLDILLADLNEDIRLSEQRIEALKRDNDSESLEVEYEFNMISRIEKKNIESLIDLQQNSYSSSPCVVQIGYKDKDKELRVFDTYESKLLK